MKNRAADALASAPAARSLLQIFSFTNVSARNPRLLGALHEVDPRFLVFRLLRRRPVDAVGLPQFELGLLALVPLLDGPQVADDARVDLGGGR